jgi:hypothetical protein
MSNKKYLTILKELKEYYKESAFFFMCSALMIILEKNGYKQSAKDTSEEFIERIIPQFNIFLLNEVKRVLGKDYAYDYNYGDALPIVDMYFSDKEYSIKDNDNSTIKNNNYKYNKYLKKYKIFLLEREINRVEKIINK